MRRPDVANRSAPLSSQIEAAGAPSGPDKVTKQGLHSNVVFLVFASDGRLRRRELAVRRASGLRIVRV